MSYRKRILVGSPSVRELIAVMTPRERAFFWIAAVNFVIFVGGVFILGGDAVSGMSYDGRYFLGDKGAYTEVSRGVFIYSYVQLLSGVITHPLGIGAIFNAKRRARRISREISEPIVR